MLIDFLLIIVCGLILLRGIFTDAIARDIIGFAASAALSASVFVLIGNFGTLNEPGDPLLAVLLVLFAVMAVFYLHRLLKAMYLAPSQSQHSTADQSHR